MVRQSFEYSAAISGISGRERDSGFWSETRTDESKESNHQGDSVAIRFIVNFIQGLHHLEHIAHRAA